MRGAAWDRCSPFISLAYVRSVDACRDVSENHITGTLPVQYSALTNLQSWCDILIRSGAALRAVCGCRDVLWRSTPACEMHWSAVVCWVAGVGGFTALCSTGQHHFVACSCALC
jgi:hypothetical protein